MPVKLAKIYQNIKGLHAVRGCLLLSLWEKVVDEPVRKNAEPIKITRKTLYLSTSSPSWAQELSFLKRELIRKFNEMAGEAAIQDIKFRAARD